MKNEPPSSAAVSKTSRSASQPSGLLRLVPLRPAHSRACMFVLEGKTIASEPEEPGIAIPRDFGGIEQCLKSMVAAMLMALGIMLVLYGHACSRRLPDV